MTDADARPRILAFAGSARTGSFNVRLLKAAMGLGKDLDAEFTVLDLADYPMPIYDGDLEEEQGLPENAWKLKELFLAHDGLLLCCPEYNSSITPLLKNVIDWVSRPVEGEAPLACFDGKVAALLAASPGGLGGLRGLVPVRSILGNIKVIVLPGQLAISKAHEAFDDDGSLKDAKQAEQVRGILEALVDASARMKDG